VGKHLDGFVPSTRNGILQRTIGTFLLGTIVTVFFLLLVSDLGVNFYLWYSPYTLETLSSYFGCGVLIGLIVPKNSLQLKIPIIGSSTIVGTILFFVVYDLLRPGYVVLLAFQITSNFFASAIGGFLGGLLGSLVRRQFR
jgi:hypothetical protein